MARPSRAKQDREAILAEKRAKRAKIGGNRNVLTVSDQDDDYTYRWFTVNDHGGRYSVERLEFYKQLGWEHVTHQTEVGDSGVDVASNTGSVIEKRVGGGDTMYLMRIEKELYEEGSAAQQADIAEKEQAMTQQLNSGKDGQYGQVTIK